MQPKYENIVPVCAIIVVFLLIIAFGSGFGVGSQSIRNEAIKVGVAKYIIDDNNEKVFVWKK